MVKNEDHIIYKAENKVTGEIYIGATKLSLNSRKYNHEYNAANNPTSKLHHSIIKHGKENFEWTVIDSTDNKEDALILERVYIDYYLSFYSLNGNRGGQGLSGRKHTDEAKQIMREKKLGIPKSDQHRMNMSKSAKGKHHGELSGLSKLTENEVREIKRLLFATTFTQLQIAMFFNVSQSTIWSIKNNKTWKHIS